MLATMLLCGPAQAETVMIKWNGDYMRNSEDTWSPSNKYRSGLSKNFLNGSPEEFGKVKREGNLQADLIKPKGSVGPVPFVILMHGCSGQTNSVLRKWAKEKGKIFVDQGYGVLVLDSFSTRGVKKTCGDPNYHWGLRRAEDAYSALDYLIDNKLADPKKVYVFGRSNGGTAAMMIGLISAVAGHRNTFAAAFAISPSCAGLTTASFGIPLVLFLGEKDDANDPKICKQVRRNDGPVQIIEFKGAHHGYEDKGPTYTFNGWHMEYNPKADRESMEVTIKKMQTDKFTSDLELR